MKKNTATALATLVTGALVLTACGGSSTVKGKRDDLRHIPSVAEQSHKETQAKKVRECASKNKKGRCTSYRTVVRGTKVVKVIDRRSKPDVWCVELDDVNNKKSRDDRWYEVTRVTYLKMADKNEGDRVKFDYLTTGCTQ